MSTRDNLLKAHSAAIALLDAKLANMPEWQVFKAIDVVMREFVEKADKPTPKHQEPKKPAKRRPADSPPTYTVLAEKIMNATGKPVPTPKMVEYIGQHRKLNTDPAKAKSNVVSALSHDDKFKSIEWGDGRAWWWADKAAPKNETANLL